MGHNSAQDQILFQEVEENNANPTQTENQKDLMEEESSNRQILEKELSPVRSEGCRLLLQNINQSF